MSMVSTTNFNALFKSKAFPLLAALLLNIFLMGCGGGGSSDDGTSNAQKPIITVQPKDANYTLGDTIAPLSVTANVTDGGNITYQWYETTNPSNNGNEISGATTSTYTPAISNNGTFYYYVVITNTNNNVNGSKTANVTSNTAQIIVNKFVDAAVPNITVQPQDANYTLGNAIAPLNVTATVTDGGNITYQWYETTNPSNNGNEISGAISSTYSPSTSTVGTFYYYVVITNTNNNVNGNKTANVTSDTAKIVVNSNNPPIAPINAAVPIITVQPKDANYTRGDTAIALSVTATSPDGGTLSYQWYETTNPSNNGNEISGAISSTYSPSTSTVGTFYYYVVVTNTNNNVNGNKTANVTSDTAQIIINLPIYSVNFYDENLDFLETVNETEGNINPSTIKTGSWYKANETLALTNHNLNESINLYALPNVQEVTTQEELAAINTNDVTLNGTYILLNDINLTVGEAGFDATLGWTPIGSDANHFRGLFNGNNNTITNLWINRTTSHVGFFGSLEYAQIRNLGVKIAEGKKIKGNDYVGGIVGVLYYGSITNSHFIGNVDGISHIGGIAGNIQYNNITNSHFIGNINSSSSNYVGGIAGSVYNGGNIIDSYSIGNVSGNELVGGIAGVLYYGNGNIIDSYSTGNISGYQHVGGIVGDVGYGSVTNSYSTGNVNGSYQYIGGIAGGINYGSITNSYSAGNISGNDNYVGGIAGIISYGSVTNSYSTGSVNGYYYIGGIIGHITYSSTVQNNAAINPSVTGNNYVNRVAGGIDSTNTASNNFALDTMSGGSSGGFSNDGDINYHGTDKTDVELKTQTTYSDAVGGGLGWKFGNDAANPWKINEGNSYPYLYWQK
ncbi:MAG: hypothetical protein LBT96_00840 [Campylobacteraceae bacterium]|jgi:hypothetical protein|nr:hypothetical protein [Campylobacteraceae bacterium]